MAVIDREESGGIAASEFVLQHVRILHKSPAQVSLYIRCVMKSNKRGVPPYDDDGLCRRLHRRPSQHSTRVQSPRESVVSMLQHWEHPMTWPMDGSMIRLRMKKKMGVGTKVEKKKCEAKVR